MSIAITNTDHYSNIADSVRYSKDAAAYESSLARAKAERDSIIDRSITSIENEEVTSIGSSVFQSCSNLTSVSFPRVTGIGSSAFQNCTNLTSVSFPNVTSIGYSAFLNCTNLTSVSFPELQTIRNNAFQSCGALTSVSFPRVTNIGSGVFQSCRSLTSVILGARASLTNSNSFSGANNAIIYVQPEDLSWYSTATNWSTLYAQDRIKSIEDLTGDDLVWYQEQLARYQEVS